MSIKLIALDLDGTLLDSRKRLSVANREALLECARRGIHVVPSTGRTIIGIPEEIKNLPGVRYVITLNGGVVLDMAGPTVMDEKKLDSQKALEIMKIASRYHVMYDAYIDGMGISEERFYNHLDDYNISKEIQKLVKLTRRVVPNIEEYVETSGLPVEKVNMYFGSMEDREEVRRILTERDDVIVSSSIENNLEVNAPGATKGEGLCFLAGYLGLSMEETMACGDGGNDLSMISAAGIGVAMGNGEESAKVLADFVTTGNDEDGVAVAIRRFALS